MLWVFTQRCFMYRWVAVDNVAITMQGEGAVSDCPECQPCFMICGLAVGQLEVSMQNFAVPTQLKSVWLTKTLKATHWFLIVKAFNKDKALVRMFSGHCEISWSLVDSSTVLAAATWAGSWCGPRASPWLAACPPPAGTRTPTGTLCLFRDPSSEFCCWSCPNKLCWGSHLIHWN